MGCSGLTSTAGYACRRRKQQHRKRSARDSEGKDAPSRLLTHTRAVQPLLAAYAHFGASVTSYWWFHSYRQGASIPFKYFTARGLPCEGHRQNSKQSRELRGRHRVHGTSGAPTLLLPGPLEMIKCPNIQVLGVNWQQNFSVQKPCYKQ